MTVSDEQRAYVGFGAIAALHSVLHVTTTHWFVALQHSFETDIAMDSTPYQLAFDGMIFGLRSIPAGPIWDDARRQFLALFARYRELVDQLPTMPMADLRAAMAEAAEAQQI